MTHSRANKEQISVATQKFGELTYFVQLVESYSENRVVVINVLSFCPSLRYIFILKQRIKSILLLKLRILNV